MTIEEKDVRQKDVRNTEIRTEEVRNDAVRDTQVRKSAKKTRRSKQEGADELYINPEEIPDGFTVEWKRISIYGQEDRGNLVGIEKDGWEPANPKDFPSLVGKNHKGSTIIAGKGNDLMLYIRPKELTAEAKAEDLHNARSQVNTKMQELGLAGSGEAPRVDSAGRSLVSVKRSYERIPVE